ncbi:hypothetical protein [Halarcobacter sp.]|uniref:hypothetical protein n=1 Tax=Halarcobacter sp. TaxID=2321133 RepID=UPI0029F50E66|nr:hypothetical protein [Halarcobacter sp.]
MDIQEENEFLGLLDTSSEDLNIINLIENYKIKTDDSFLYSATDDYKALIAYISDLYFEQKSIPFDIIEEIINNKNLKSVIILVIEEKMNNILFDSTTIVFKEIVTIIDLLSMGNNFNIFENYNTYNLDNLSSLFRTYEDRLKELEEKGDELDFDITFKQYSMLIETINQVCSINSMDVIRKKTIKPLIEVISETINLIKFNIKLSEEKINILNNILGKLLFYYSHIPFINASNKDTKYLIDEFHFNFAKTCDGYELSKNANFANEGTKNEHYKIFLNSSTTLICNLLYKLERNYPKELYNDLSYFEDIITLYKEEINHTPFIDFKTLDEFNSILLSNYMFIYDEHRKDLSYKTVIEDFLEDKIEDYSNTFILHAIVLFSNDIDDEMLIKLLKKLISTEKYRNDYHEFLKLTICDVIIKKFVDSNKLILDDILINQIIDYVKKNKIASHLMSIYSKIYLTLSAYYSLCNDFISIEKSKLFYFYYVKINGYDLLENEFEKLNRNILLNHGNRYFEDLKFDNISINKEKALDIGKKTLEKFIIQEEITLKYNINQKLSNIITQIFTDDGLNDDLLNSHIENFISNDIFHGLTFVAVEGLCQKKCKLIDLGYERIDIPLFDKFTLKIAYSKVYKHIFEKIFEDNISYIKQNIINLIVCYLKSIPIYNDVITTLYNIEKLKIDLLKRDDKEFIFIEIHINDLINLNKKYGYEKTNIYFKEYALKLNDIHQIYRLNGPSLALVLEQNDDYKSIIEKIRNIDFLTKDETIKPKLTIGVSWGDRTNIVEKSTLSMNLAQENHNKYYEFK